MPRLTHISGNLAMPGFTAPKLHWMRANEPENYARIAKVLLPKDYVRYLMSGAFASDMSDSAGTLWLDVKNRRWSDDLLALTGLTQNHMPELFEGSEATAKLSQSVADDWGMARVPIAAGGGDNAAGAVGAGVVNPGEGFIALEGVAFALADGLDVLRDTGAAIENISVIGGGSRSNWWGKIIASAMNVPLTYRQSSAVGPAFGAARLARLCTSNEDYKSVCTPPPVDHVIDPDSDMRELYADRRETFTKLYKATKELTS